MMEDEKPSAPVEVNIPNNDPSKNRTLLRSQKDQCFESVSASGLDPARFRWGTVESMYMPDVAISKLTHEPTGFFFEFDWHHRAGHICRYSPGEHERITVYEAVNWAGSRASVTLWLAWLGREIEAPDFWAEVGREQDWLKHRAETNVLNEPIEPGQKASVHARLDEVKQYLLREHVQTQEQREFIEERLSDLDEAVDRLGRIDWYDKATSVFLQIIVTLGLSGPAANEAFSFLLRSVKFVVRLHLDT